MNNQPIKAGGMAEYPPNESVICEALVREISYAGRWSAVENAWRALLHVRAMAESLSQEKTLFDNGGQKISP